MIDELHRQRIDESEVVSFDVFDTLLLRHHYFPSDVFRELGFRSRFLPSRVKRILAEKIARWKHRHQEDVTLAQIYRYLGCNDGEEVAAELQSNYRNPEVAALFTYAKSRGKRVVAISDMYLPTTVIHNILANAGYSGLDAIYVSSELLMTKASGSIFKHVARDLGVPPEAIVHVGDNAWSDKTQAEQAGLKSIFLPMKRSRFESRLPLHRELFNLLKSRKKPLYSLILGLNRDRFSHEPSSISYWYVLGYSVLGPIANAFVEWIAKTAVEKKATKTIFLARDGCLPHQIYRLRFPDRESTYAHASRRFFLIPSLASCSDEELLDGLCGGLPNTPAREYWTRLGLEDDAVDALFLEHFSDDEKIVSLTDHSRLRTFFRAAIPLLRRHAEAEKLMLDNYLKQIGLLNSEASPLLVDIGWRASSQRYLETAFPSLKAVPGAYFGLSRDAYRNGLMSAFFFDYGAPAAARNLAMHCVELLELMFSAPEESVRRLTQNEDGALTPVLEPSSPEEHERARIIAELHRAAMEFTRDLQLLEAKGYDISLDRQDAMNFLAPLMLRPEHSDILHIGQVPHALGVGASRYETLLPDSLPSNPIRLLMDLASSKRRRLYWPRGITRGIAFQHGPVAGFGARCSITFYFVLLKLREQLLRCIRR